LIHKDNFFPSAEWAYFLQSEFTVIIIWEIAGHRSHFF
jgi:hypothetical protein